MTNQPVSSIAHLLGFPKSPASKTTSELRRDAALSRAAVAATKAENAKAGAAVRRQLGVVLENSTTGSKMPAKPVAASPARRSFAHLIPTTPAHDDTDAAPSIPGPAPMSPFAAAVVAASAKAKTPTGTGVAAPTGLAARILAAGKKRRELSK